MTAPEAASTPVRTASLDRARNCSSRCRDRNVRKSVNTVQRFLSIPVHHAVRHETDDPTAPSDALWRKLGRIEHQQLAVQSVRSIKGAVPLTPDRGLAHFSQLYENPQPHHLARTTRLPRGVDSAVAAALVIKRCGSGRSSDSTMSSCSNILLMARSAPEPKLTRLSVRCRISAFR